MGILEGALITLVLVWTLIFVVLGIAVIIFLRGMKKSLDKINNILSQAETFTNNVTKMETPMRVMGSALMGIIDHARGKQNNKKSSKK